jgi:hypothetical protein
MNKNNYHNFQITRYYNLESNQELRFFQIPKSIIYNPKYRSLSAGAKIVYSILRDRHDLSVRNRWVDGGGCIYLYYRIEKLSDILRIAFKLFENLLEVNKSELIKILEQIK